MESESMTRYWIWVSTYFVKQVSREFWSTSGTSSVLEDFRPKPVVNYILLSSAAKEPFLDSFSFCCCCCLVARLCLTLCDPMDCSTPGFPVLHYLLEFAQIHVHWVGDSNDLILCHPLLLLPSIFPTIRVFLVNQIFASGGQNIGAQLQSFQRIFRVVFL